MKKTQTPKKTREPFPDSPELEYYYMLKRNQRCVTAGVSREEEEKIVFQILQYTTLQMHL